ncbi:hypothetical protein J2736_002126 [Paenibacillus qinlingensis]|uniref:Uncharacterized protein n=1 Tax=Paenibacillus qinlingensis TaxID=1837343 RepID=A0ABU1NUD2_9BACL|nr:hypothetical protein [Paenibacillus qinlingensis]
MDETNKENPKSRNCKQETNEVPSFNSVTDHYGKILGVPNKRVDLRTMPKFLRWFAYLFYTILILGGILFIFSVIFRK